MARSKRTSSRAIVVLVALLLAAIVAVVAAIGSQGFTNKNVKTWFNGWGNADNVGDPGNSISLATYALTAEDYADFGISEQAIEAKVITAEFEPANATNKRVNWVWKWAGDNPEWSEDKAITDYVEFTAASNYAPELTFAVIEPFGDGIIVECTSRAKPELSDSVQIEYIVKYNEFEGDLDLDYGESIDFFSMLTTEDSTWTIVPDAYSATVTVYYSPAVMNDVYEQNGDDVDDYVVFDNITGPLTWERLWDVYPETPYEPSVAKYCIDHNNKFFLELDAKITCYYKGEAIYTFTVKQTCSVYFTAECIEEMSIPPTSVKLPGSTIVV